jgi:hypothetical protein
MEQASNNRENGPELSSNSLGGTFPRNLMMLTVGLHGDITKIKPGAQTEDYEFSHPASHRYRRPFSSQFQHWPRLAEKYLTDISVWSKTPPYVAGWRNSPNCPLLLRPTFQLLAFYSWRKSVAINPYHSYQGRLPDSN